MFKSLWQKIVLAVLVLLGGGYAVYDGSVFEIFTSDQVTIEATED